ncbi:MAG: ABC transporter ATP-binding protein, partial [Bacteroidales bacterium]
FVRRFRWVSAMVILLLGNIALQAISPQIMRNFINQVSGKANSEQIIRSALFYLLTVIAGQIVYALATYVSASVGWTATNHFRRDLTMHCLKQDLSFQKNYSPGEMIERIDGDLNVLGNFFSQFTVRVLGNSLLVMIVLILIWLESWQIGLVYSFYIGVSFAFLLTLQTKTSEYFRALRQWLSHLSGFWEELLSTSEDIKSLGAENYIEEQNITKQKELIIRGRRAMVFFRSFISAMGAVFLIGNVLAIGMGTYLLQDGQIVIGTIFLLIVYTNLLATNLGNIANEVNDYHQATVALERLNELLSKSSSLEEGILSCSLPSAPEITFEEVSFCYQPNLSVLQKISFTVEEGQVLGIIGRTGSGKSTIARLLFRFYDPGQGEIKINHLDIRKFKLSELRSSIGFVTQDVQLYQASIRDNLSFFNPQIPDAQIISALEDVGLKEWLSSFEHGLDTMIHADFGLSGGEAQLLAFARVLLKNPKIIILDEASSRLDAASEAKLDEALNRLLSGRTVIIIAHRLNTLQRVDKILWIENGVMKEFGAYQTLSKDLSSHFSWLLQMELKEGSLR